VDLTPPHDPTIHALTVDLEEWYHGIELAPSAWPSQSRLHIGLGRLQCLLDRHSVRATFFVLGVIAEAHPRLVAELADAGHEIGCHSHRHEFVYRQSPDTFRADLQQARDVIASATGTAPIGYRAPYFSIRGDSLWALEILANEGFRYDSSIFPVRNPRYGIPDAPRVPYDHDLPDDASLREIPLTPARFLGQNVPFSGGAYLRILPWDVQSAFWRAQDRHDEPVMAYIHPWELDPDHPRIPLPRRVAMTHYARLDVTEPRLDRLLSTYRFGRICDVFS
jgi:polysaccharide deacetylase family protein (PEP-CTERM system associated)